MWNLLICDDDRNFLRQFKQQIIETAGDIIGSIGCIPDWESLRFHLEEKDYRLPCIAVIELKFANGTIGTEMAKQLLKVNPFVQIIFLSAYENYSLSVYDVEHIFFLEKPVKKERLKKALQRAERNLSKIQTETLPIVTRTNTVVVPVEQIIYLEKDKRKINVFTTNDEKPYSFYAKFSDIDRYRTANFCRCHNSYDINLKYIREMKGPSFYMQNGAKIPISRNKYQDTKAQYFQFLKRYSP